MFEIIDLRILSLTCIGWYAATDDTNTTFPPLQEKHKYIKAFHEWIHSEQLLVFMQDDA